MSSKTVPSACKLSTIKNKVIATKGILKFIQSFSSAVVRLRRRRWRVVVPRRSRESAGGARSGSNGGWHRRCWRGGFFRLRRSSAARAQTAGRPHEATGRGEGELLRDVRSTSRCNKAAHSDRPAVQTFLPLRGSGRLFRRRTGRSWPAPKGELPFVDWDRRLECRGRWIRILRVR